MPTIPAEIRDRALRFGDRVAVTVDGGSSMTFAQWETRSDTAAGVFRDRGVGRGDRVALLLENTEAVEFAVGYVGAQKAGAAAVPVNPRYAPREIEHVLSDSGARVVVTDMPERARGAEIVLPPDLGGAHAAPLPAVGEEDLADVLYTSGTTGLPKGVASTHGQATALELGPSDEGGGLLHAVPLPTFLGTHGAQLVAARLAITNIVAPRFDPHRFAQLIAEHRPTSLLMVPAHILLLREADALEGVDTSPVGMIMFGSAPTPPDAFVWLGQAFPHAYLMHGYGMTEAGMSVVVCAIAPGEAEEKAGSLGTPMPGTELRIVRDGGEDAGPGEVGEVWLRVASGRRSYFGDADLTAQTWDEEGWLHTGDLGYRDEGGALYLVDRAKDMIVRGGYKVYCIEVESVLHDHPAVVEAAVVGMPHDVLGQDVAAVVRVEPGFEALTLDDLREFLADRLADYKHPRRLQVVTDPLPRTGIGKVDKKRLVAEQAAASEGGDARGGR